MSAYSGVTQRISTAASGLNANRATAIVIWLIGAWLTSNTLAQLGIPEPINYAFGLAAQWILTKAQSPLWQGRGYPPMAVGATAGPLPTRGGSACRRGCPKPQP